MLRLILALFLALLSQAAAQNLILTNPGMESSSGSFFNGGYSISGWSGNNPRYASHGVSSGAPGAGSKSWQLTNGGSLTTTTANRAVVTGGRSYLFSFQMRKTADSPSLQIGLVGTLTFYDAGGATVKIFHSPEVQPTGTCDWRRVRLLGTAPATAVSAGLNVSFSTGSYPNEDGRTFGVDDFSLTEFTETDTVGFRNAPMFVSAGAAGGLEIKYRVDAEKDLLVRLNDGAANVAEIRTAVGAVRRGVASVSVPVPAGAAASDGYEWQARLVPTGGAWGDGAVTATQSGVFLDDAIKTTDIVAPTDARLIYEGRWDDSSSSRRRAFWMGTALHARFTGTSFKLRCTFNHDSLPLLVQVDGSPTLTSVSYANAANVTKTLVSGLAPGIHTIKIIRNGSEANGLWDVTQVELDASCGLLRHAPHMPRRIDAYGDSTMSGGDGGMYVNFSTTTARTLGAGVSVVSKGGTGVSGGFIFQNNGLYYWDRMTFNPFYDSNPGSGAAIGNPYTYVPENDPGQTRGLPWGPGNFPAYGDPASWAEIASKGKFATQRAADAVIIGWGQNDQFGGGPWESNYRQFVILQKKLFPNVHIFCTHTNMTDGGYIQKAAQPIVDDRGPGGLNEDGRVHFLPLNSFPGTSGHPTTTQQPLLALGETHNRGTADWIEETLGWGGGRDVIAFTEPNIAPKPARYDTAQSVTLTTFEPGASFRYTTDGTWPTSTTGTLYTGAFNVSATTTIRAIAYGPGLLDSPVTTGTITIAAATPTASPAAGTFTSAQNVALSTTTVGAEIRYTTNGSTPTAASTLYTAPINVAATTTIKALAIKAGIGNSGVYSGTFTISATLAATPTFSPPAQNFTDPLTITLSTATSGASIRYTTDGTDPSDTDGTLYTAPFPITATTVVKAVAFASGMGNSAIASATYTYQPLTCATPTITPAGGAITGPVQVTLSTTTPSATLRYSTDGLTVPSDTDGTLYTGPFMVSSTAAVRACASRAGFQNSTVATLVFTLTASAPEISPAPGIYSAPLAVYLSTPSAGAELRYTLDGTAPTAASTLYAGPFSLNASATVRAIAVGNGYAASAVSSASYTVYEGLAAWRTAYGLASDGTQDFLAPAGDGVPSLLKFAFDLGAPLSPNVETLAPDGIAGLPRVDLDATSMRLTFVRQKVSADPGIIYRPLKSDDLGAWSEIPDPPALLTDLDANWERVTYALPLAPGRGFAKVEVRIPTPTSGTLNSLAADASLTNGITIPQDGGGSVTSTGATAVIGNSAGAATNVRSIVYVFQLPNLGAQATPFTSASFTCRLTSGGNTFANFAVDLYGLGARTAATVLAQDYYLGGNDTTDAVKLVDNFVVFPNSNSTATVGDKTTSATALLNYLNAQYANGAGIGKHVFLRINADRVPPDFKTGTFALSEDSSTDPRITFTATTP